METLLNQLSKDQVTYVENQVAAGNFTSPIACVQSLVAEAIQLRQRKAIEQKLLVALDEYDRGECSEWTKEDRKRLLANSKVNGRCTSRFMIVATAVFLPTLMGCTDASKTKPESAKRPEISTKAQPENPRVGVDLVAELANAQAESELARIQLEAAKAKLATVQTEAAIAELERKKANQKSSGNPGMPKQQNGGKQQGISPANIEGCFILAEDKQYLGKVSRDEYNAESILNDYGKYGGKYSSTSIFNEYGRYGGKYATNSPFNSYASTPPKIFKNDGGFVAYLTVNALKSPRVDPYALIAYLKNP